MTESSFNLDLNNAILEAATSDSLDEVETILNLGLEEGIIDDVLMNTDDADTDDGSDIVLDPFRARNELTRLIGSHVPEDILNRALVVASTTPNNYVFEILLNAGADPYTENGIVFQNAIYNNDITKIQELLETPYDPENQHILNTSLLRAVNRGGNNIEAVALLLTEFIPISVLNSALAISLRNNNQEIYHLINNYIHERTRIRVQDEEYNETLGGPLNIVVDENSETTECPVCLETIEPSNRYKIGSCQCKNVYHKGCLERWSERTCPTCRARFFSRKTSRKSKGKRLSRKRKSKRLSRKRSLKASRRT
jgi:hypothetical protein